MMFLEPLQPHIQPIQRKKQNRSPQQIRTEPIIIAAVDPTKVDMDSSAAAWLTMTMKTRKINSTLGDGISGK